MLSEYRDNAVGTLLRNYARDMGYEHQAWTEGHRGNGVLVASVYPFASRRNPFGLPEDEYPNAVLQATFECCVLFGVYLPGQDRKRPHLRCLLATARRYNEKAGAAICIGDFNSGRNETDIEVNVRSGSLRDEFSTADLYAELESAWTEAWAHFHPSEFDYSWYPARKDGGEFGGWRIDKAFVSRELLSRTTAAEYDHFFRRERLTDHSALVVDISACPGGC